MRILRKTPHHLENDFKLSFPNIRCYFITIIRCFLTECVAVMQKECKISALVGCFLFLIILSALHIDPALLPDDNEASGNDDDAANDLRQTKCFAEKDHTEEGCCDRQEVGINRVGRRAQLLQPVDDDQVSEAAVDDADPE